MGIEVVYYLACYGLTFALCDASVLDTPRHFIRTHVSFVDSLLACYFCTGFWVSGAWYLVLYSGLLGGHYDAIMWPTNVVWAIANAFAGATFVYVLNAAIVALETWAERNKPRIVEPDDGA